MEVFYAYSPYGQSVTLGPDGGNDLQYAGLRNDGTGLYYALNRYYDPVLKQWTSEDPIGIAGGINLHAYVAGNPISFTDPTGEAVPIIVVAAAIGGAVGGVVGAVQAGNQGGWSWSNARNIAQGFGIGALSGAVSTIPIGRAAMAATAGAGAIGAVAGFAGNVASQRASGTSWSCIDWRQAGFQGGVGLYAGLLAGAAYGPYPVANAALWAAGLGAAGAAGMNLFVGPNLGGLGAFPLVK